MATAREGWPDFFVLGTVKAGTSSLFLQLSRHPGAFLPTVKEPLFFAHDGAPRDYPGRGDRAFTDGILHDAGEYLRLYEGAPPGARRGDCSTWYLHDRGAAERIRRRVPDARLVMVLRDPAERAFSSFLHLVRDGRETTREFRAGLEAEPERIRAGWDPLWHYRAAGLYHDQVKRYLDRFPRERVLVRIYEEALEDPGAHLRSILEFIGVDPSFEPDLSVRANPSLLKRSRRLHEFLTGPNRLRSMAGRLLPPGARRRVAESLYRWNFHRPRLPADLRADLVAGFREDVLRLQELLRRDLSRWLA